MLDQSVESSPLQRWAPSIIAVLVVLCAGVGAFVVTRGVDTFSAARGATHALSGELYLQSTAYLDNEIGGNCVGRGAKSTVTTGAPVQVKDQGGTIVGSGSVAQGKVISWGEFLASTDATGYDGRMDAPAACKFKLSVGDVGDAEVYSFEVGTKVLVTKTKAELADSKWKLNFMDGWTLRK